MIITGDTIRLYGTFYTFAGALVDPTSPTIKIYSDIGRQLLVTDTPTKESTGVYYYDYTVPDISGDIVFEFSGTAEGTPTVGRASFGKAWHD